MKATKPKKKRRAPYKPGIITFVDKRGRTMKLPGNLNIGDLHRMGFKNIGLVPPETPMKKNEWRNKP